MSLRLVVDDSNVSDEQKYSTQSFVIRRHKKGHMFLVGSVSFDPPQNEKRQKATDEFQGNNKSTLFHFCRFIPYRSCGIMHYTKLVTVVHYLWSSDDLGI
jgi:hypothetical protein